jgi:hypothetical protein
VNFNLPSKSLVSLLQKSEFAAQVLGFEKLGWDLTIVGGQPKMPIVPSIVYGLSLRRWLTDTNFQFSIRAEETLPKKVAAR